MVDDGAGSTALDTAALTIANVAPTVAISAPADGSAVAVGAPVGVVAVISDPGTTDTTTCSVDWGDGSPSTMCDATHVFGSPGVFSIVLIASDGAFWPAAGGRSRPPILPKIPSQKRQTVVHNGT